MALHKPALVYRLKTKSGTFELKPGNHWISVTEGMSGHFAVEMWINPEMGGFPEPYETGIGRYKTVDEAREEAQMWAENEDLPLEIA